MFNIQLLFRNQRCNLEQVWLAARFVVLGLGSIPNSELFRDSLELSSDGGIITDSSLRTSHPSGDVFAAGEIACVPAPLGGIDENTHLATVLRSEHVQGAREMGAHAAKMMQGGATAAGLYDPVPQMYSRSVFFAVHLHFDRSGLGRVAPGTSTWCLFPGWAGKRQIGPKVVVFTGFTLSVTVAFRVTYNLPRKPFENGEGPTRS